MLDDEADEVPEVSVDAEDESPASDDEEDVSTRAMQTPLMQSMPSRQGLAELQSGTSPG